MNTELSQQPHQILGSHGKGDKRVIRCYRPRDEKAFLEIKGESVEGNSVGEGLFEYWIDEELSPLDYQVTHASGLCSYDPYAFLPTFSLEDEKAFGEGKHYAIDEVMGGRVTEHQGAKGVKFAVWAPCAKRVNLVGDFNGWNHAINPMRLMGSSGVWELFVPGLEEGEKYKFLIEGADGGSRLKADPYGYQGEMRPNTASVVCRVDRHQWNDDEWMKKRKKPLDHPINIYELHIGSWKKQGDDFINYRILAPKLSAYCHEMGYTHVELMPVLGHPLDESWGYQVTGFYAISRRYGTIEDFQWMVDHLHQEGIGVILDWVPAHFPTDDHSIAQFDGSYLYEHKDPRQGYHPHWNTHIFNYGRYEVANFLIGSALFYLDKMHIDGLRVDGVASMLYLDYGREGGDWVPNKDGGKENLEAIDFLKHLNRIVHEKFPSCLMIAEESSAFKKMTTSVDEGGMGFDLKWHMGWMNRLLCYLETDLDYRHYKHELLLEDFRYYFSEKFILVLSHDEVVHGKKHLLTKMPGNEWEKFAGLRLLISYMICHPGKKLLFMGGELGHWHEWDCKEEIHWSLLQLPYHKKLHECVKGLNHFYLKEKALWEADFDPDHFHWIAFDDNIHSVIAYRRGNLILIHHFSRHHLEDYFLPLEGVEKIEEIFNTDSKEYGGYGIMNDQIKWDKKGFYLRISPLSTLILRYD